MSKLYPQAPEKRSVTKFNELSGLSSYNIRNILQDPFGFMWIATQDGLNRFDGNNFVTYSPGSLPPRRLLSNDVRRLALDTSRHLLWALTSMGGLDAIDYLTGRVVRSVPVMSNDKDDWNITMTLQAQRLWIGGMTSVKCYDINSNTLSTVPLSALQKNQNNDLYSVRALCNADNDFIWAFINHYGIAIINARTKQLARYVPAASDISYGAAIPYQPGKLLAGTSAGVKQFTYRQDSVINVSALFPAVLSGNVTAFAPTDKGLFIAGAAGLYRAPPDLSNITPIQGVESDDEHWLQSIYGLYLDKDQSLWMGCKEGLARLSQYQPPFERVMGNQANTVEFSHVYAVLPYTRDHILVGLEKGLIDYNTRTRECVVIDEQRSFNFSFIDFAGRTIVSADDGLHILQGRRLAPIQTIYPELAPVAAAYINSCVPMGDTMYIIGSDSDRGIFLWNYRRKTLRIISNSSAPLRLNSNIVNKVYKDHNGAIWVLSDKGIDIIDPQLNRVQHTTFKHPQTGMPLQLFFDVCEYDHQYWLTSYGNGVIVLDSALTVRKVFNTINGLSNNGVYKIFNYKDASLIVSSNKGLSVISPKDSSIKTYYQQDGLHSNEFEEGSGMQVGDRIYAGGVNGFTIIDPSLFRRNLKPPVLYIDNIHIQTRGGTIDTSHVALQRLAIPNDVLQTVISFTGINYLNAARTQFFYKITELDDKWIPIGAQRFVTLTGLHPGKYTIEIKCANEDGVWNQQPIALTLVYLPKWHQTLLFKLLMIAAIIGILYAFYRYRIGEFEKQQQIRRDIASDLHDDIGSILNTLKIFTHLAKRDPGQPSYLDQIETSITQATLGLRDMIWVLDDSQDTVYELMERIKKFAAPVTHANGISFAATIDVYDKDEILPKTMKRNLLLIAKEAINNSIKYAESAHIEVCIRHQNGKIVLQVKDDGKGFAEEDIVKGNGLRNIHQRAKQINFSANIVASPGNGTFISVVQH